MKISSRARHSLKLIVAPLVVFIFALGNIDSSQARIVVLPFCPQTGSVRLNSIENLHLEFQHAINNCVSVNKRCESIVNNCNENKLITYLIENRITYYLKGTYFCLGDSVIVNCDIYNVFNVNFKETVFRDYKLGLTTYAPLFNWFSHKLSISPVLKQYYICDVKVPENSFISQYKKHHAQNEVLELAKILISLNLLSDAETVLEQETLVNIDSMAINEMYLDVLVSKNETLKAIKFITENKLHLKSRIAEEYYASLLLGFVPAVWYNQRNRRLLWYSHLNNHTQNYLYNHMPLIRGETRKALISMEGLDYLFATDLLSLRNLTDASLAEMRNLNQLNTLYLINSNIHNLHLFDGFTNLRRVVLVNCKNTRKTKQYFEQNGIEVDQ